MKTVLVAILSFLSAYNPFNHYKGNDQAAPIVAQVPAPAKPLPEKTRTTVPMYGNARSYTFVFSGQATCMGQPCAASVEVRMESSAGRLVRRMTTDPDGHYTLSVSVMGEPDEVLNWEIHALAPNLEKADLEGRQILLSETSVNLDAPLVFLNS